MIANFNTVCPDIDAKIARTAEKMTLRHNERMNSQMELCEKILEVMSDKPMKCMEICDCFPGDGYRGHEHSCQKVSAMLKKLIALGLVQRVFIEEKEIIVQNFGHWGYDPADEIEINGIKYVRPDARQKWIHENKPIQTKVYGFVKIGA